MTKMNADFEKGKKEVFAKSAAFSKDKNLQAKPEQFVGTYSDAWFGDVVVSQEGKNYRIQAKNSPRLKGDLLPYTNNTFIAKWDDRSYDADAFVIFTYDENGKAQSAKLKPISDITDFSFDFEDLDLQRIK